MTLYLKYRSQSLEELDLTEVRETLKKIVRSGKIPHAFLFAGPKGTGKTSSARILAKIINCEEQGSEPCNRCKQCISITKGANIDVIEMDAASHRGIDDVRSLRDAVKLSPASARKKVYIIDEAHMLTTEACNALLKTLEEPPQHVVFILATTNPEKLLPTILSRTTVVNFHKATTDEVVRSLTRIVAAEKLKIEKDVLAVIARTSGGSFRDAVKILEQLTLENKIDLKSAADFLLNTSNLDTAKFIKLLADYETQATLKLIEETVQKGVTAQEIIDSIVVSLRQELLSLAGVGKSKTNELEKEDLIELIEALIKAKRDVIGSPIEQLPLEIAVIEWGERGNVQSLSPAAEENDSTDKTTQSTRRNTASATKAPFKTNNKPDEAKSNSAKSTPILTKPDENQLLSDEIWKKILVQIKPINASVEALLRSSKPLSFDGSTLRLGVFYKFHKERLEDSRHRKILEDMVSQVLGTQSVRVFCELTQPEPTHAEKKEKGVVLTESQDNDIIDIAEKIFGS